MFKEAQINPEPDVLESGGVDAEKKAEDPGNNLENQRSEKMAAARAALDTFGNGLTALSEARKAANESSNSQEAFRNFLTANKDNIDRFQSQPEIATTAESKIVESGWGVEALQSGELPGSIDRTKLYTEYLSRKNNTPDQLDHNAVFSSLLNEELSPEKLKSILVKLPEGVLNDNTIKSLVEQRHAEVLLEHNDKISNQAEAGVDALLATMPPSVQYDILSRTDDIERAQQLAADTIKEALGSNDEETLEKMMEKDNLGLPFEVLGALADKMGIEYVIDRLDKFKTESFSEAERAWLETEADKSEQGEKLRNQENYRDLIIIINEKKEQSSGGAAAKGLQKERTLREQVAEVAKQVVKYVAKLAMKAVVQAVKFIWRVGAAAVKGLTSVFSR